MPLTTAAIALSSALAVAVYAASFLPDPSTRGRRLLSSHGASGYPFYDFWMGRELNPRWLGGSLDVKEFCELYPGMIGWALLNLAFAAAQVGVLLGGGGGGWVESRVAGCWSPRRDPTHSPLNLPPQPSPQPPANPSQSSKPPNQHTNANTNAPTRQLTTNPQARDHGRVGAGMLLVNAFQLWYIADGLANERAILTTMDITTDGFGFMLAFGDLAWVPFTFTTQARFLAAHPQPLGAGGVAAVLAVQAAGYLIFRGANGQKDAFRRDPAHPSVAHLKSMPTARGTRLITSGWWGAARHVNYLGDWIMGLAWCLPTGGAGAAGVVPFFYCIYFAALLAHRERRDEAACRAKYGADWDAYCRIVPWRIIPRVY